MLMPNTLIKYCVVKGRTQDQFIKLEKLNTKLMLVTVKMVSDLAVMNSMW